jgi:hypothetical protein
MSTINEMREAMEIFAKYMDGDEVLLGGAEHDVIFGPCESYNAEFSPEDKARLDDLGWYIGEYDCWEKGM